MVVGIRYDLEPFSYIAEDGALAGLDIDLARELARRWLGDPTAVEFFQVRSDTAIEHLNTGVIDFALAGIIHTQEAESGLDFGPPTFINGQALLTFPDTGVSSRADLAGRRVGVLSWTGNKAQVQAGLAFTLTAVPYDNFFQIVEGLRTRQIDVYADAHHRLERAQRMVVGTAVVGQYTWEPVALAYRENDPFFANLLAATFQQMADDGTRAALYARWLPNVAPPPAPNWIGTPPALSVNSSPRQREAGGRIAAIRARGVLNVGYLPDYWPYSADRGDGVQTGFEVRLAERLAERWLGSRQAIAFIPVSRADGLQRLEIGEVDLLVGGWIHTWDAEMRFDFSLPLFDDGVGLFSRANAPVNALTELNGRAVGVIAGSAGEAAATGMAQQAGVGLSTLTYPDRTTAIAALQSGEIGALIAERGLVLDPLSREGGFYLTDQRFTYRPVSYVLPQGDSAYRDLVNLTLARLHAEGVFNELYALWFDDAPPQPAPWPGHPIIPFNLSLLP